MALSRGGRSFSEKPQWDFMNLWDFFTDPVLRAPAWGCILMCIASSLMGVLIFLRKRSLLSESLSHATYPGVVLGVSLFAFLFPKQEEWVFVAGLAGAFFSSLLGLKAIEWLEKKGKVRPDAALCFVLAVFFGFGIVGVSAMQSTLPVWQGQVQMLLFGQAATMSDIHIVIYATLALAVSLFLCLTFRPLQAFLFDRDFASSTGIKVPALERIFFWLLLLSLIVGIRSVGVVLMSGMVIAPAVAARQFSDRLQTMFCLAALFGALSGFLGNYFSVLTSLPTGPMIVLVGTAFALLSLMFAPKRGLLFRIARVFAFRFRCLQENILKGIWKKGTLWNEPSCFSMRCALWRLKKEGWIAQQGTQFQLTEDGKKKAAFVVRLHRLWELYLTESLGFKAEKVHRTAEEMEHILTPEIEEKLTRLLSNPKQDPHQQPIPERQI
ncbi:MAG TPA: iron chelate uptake ABC transporter family permease subunit [Chlamydiales bacterium]|nr:iron chelate uptake ABC transporter family permease subunit [Chlamydiales bacterium]